MASIADSERLERNALASLFRSAPDAIRRELGLAAHEESGVFQGIAPALPSSAIVINRVLGIGVDGQATETQLSQIVARYRQARVQRYFIQLLPEARSDAVSDALRRMGLDRARAWQKFKRDVSPPSEPRSTLAWKAAGPEHGADFARIVCDAFDLGDAARPWIQMLPGAAGWHAFMSFEGDAPAGTGALYVEDGLGWLDFGATAPAFRKRGSQSLLMAARISHAAELGCHTLFTCTGEDVPGDPQHSYNNILRAGFTPTYLRENWSE